MKKPKMILFDYGQTLVNEQRFDGLKGTAEVAIDLSYIEREDVLTIMNWKELMEKLS